MKTLCILFLLICSFNVYSQKQDSVVYFTKSEVIKLANKIRLLQDSSNYKTVIINSQDTLIQIYEARSIVYIDQLKNREETIKLYKDQAEIMNKTILDLQPKWYDNKALWFIGGVVGTVITIFLLSK